MRRSVHAVLVILALTPSIFGQSVIAWGPSTFGECAVPALPTGLTYVETSAGYAHSIARRSDGSVVAWGLNNFGQCNVPSLPSGLAYVELDASFFYTIGRRSDGSLAAWGSDQWGCQNVPPGLTYVEVATGETFALARRNDGSVVGWGDNGNGQCNPPAPPIGLVYVQIAAGNSHALGLLSDGSVVAWGNNGVGSCNVPALPAGLTYLQVAAGWSLSAAVRSDGAILAWGSNANGEGNVPPLPAGLTYVQVACGNDFMVARRSDGSVVGWGSNGYGALNVPALPAGVSFATIEAGWYHVIATLTGLPAPAIASVSAVRSSLYGNVPCTITGTNLAPGTSVEIGGVPLLNPTFVDFEHVTGLTPPLSTPQDAPVSVWNGAGSATAVAPIHYDHAVLIIPPTASLGSTVELRIASYPTKPLICLADIVPGPFQLGVYGYAGVGFSPALLVVLDYFGAFGGGPNFSATTDAGGQWTSPVAIPNDPGLVGVSGYVQAYVFSYSPFPPNTFFFFSNTATLTVVP